jgi:hypothetical protein
MRLWLLEKAYWKVYNMRLTSYNDALLQGYLLMKIIKWKDGLNA